MTTNFCQNDDHVSYLNEVSRLERIHCDSRQTVVPLVDDVAIVLVVELIGKVCSCTGSAENGHEARGIRAILSRQETAFKVNWYKSLMHSEYILNTTMR